MMERRVKLLTPIPVKRALKKLDSDIREARLRRRMPAAGQSLSSRALPRRIRMRKGEKMSECFPMDSVARSLGIATAERVQLAAAFIR